MNIPHLSACVDSSCLDFTVGGKQKKTAYLLLIERKLKTHPHPQVTKEDQKACER